MEVAHPLEKTGELLKRLSWRRDVAALAHGTYRWSLMLIGLCLALLLTIRLLGLIPDFFRPAYPFLIPLLALLPAFVFLRRTRPEKAARLADAHSRNEDLFLTASSLDEHSGDYQTVVRRQAETRAPDLAPDQIVPWSWARKSGRLLLWLLFLGGLVMFLPQLDPFGKEKVRVVEEKRLEKLEALDRQTEARLEELTKGEAQQRSEQVQAALGELKKTFKMAKPEAKEANLARLQKNQQSLGQLWRKLSEERMQNAVSSDPPQSFGGFETARLKKLKNDLARGDFSEAREQIERLKDLAAELARTTDPAEQRRLQADLLKTLQDLKKAMEESGGSKGMKNALARAAEQGEMGRISGLSQKALEDLAQSLDLGGEELNRMERAMMELEQLEKGLTASQLAKQLNEMGKLQGQGEGMAGGGEPSLDDYAKLYESMMGGQKSRNGGGMRGPGVGEGGLAPEDDSLKTNFKSERSRSQLTKGKTILDLKAKGMGTPGQANEAYRDQVRELQQGVSEAIRQEKVPAGYHDNIQKYFDALPEVLPGNAP